MHASTNIRGRDGRDSTEAPESPPGLGSRVRVWVCCHGEMEKDLGKDLGSYGPAVPTLMSEEMSSDSVLLPLT